MIEFFAILAGKDDVTEFAAESLFVFVVPNDVASDFGVLAEFKEFAVIKSEFFFGLDDVDENGFCEGLALINW